MRILCETRVVTRQTNCSKKHRKATLAIGYNTSAKDRNGVCQKELEIIHFATPNQIGVRYKVKNNVVRIYTKFVMDGKATISFIQPAENIMIKCNPIQLRAFFHAIKIFLEGKEKLDLLEPPEICGILSKSQPVESLIILKRSNYPTKGFPRTLKYLTISGIQLCRVTFELCALSNLTGLNLSYNAITQIPHQVGRLRLTELHLSSNSLGEKNDWRFLKGKNIRETLKELDLSCNKLDYLPFDIFKLENLVTLKLNHNKLKRIPFGIRRLRKLRFFHASTNDLVSLPANFNYNHLEVLDVWGNNFQPRKEHDLDDKTISAAGGSAPIPLWLMACRSVCQNKLPYSTNTLPTTLVDILREAPLCACGKLCYDYTILERATMATFQNIKMLIFSRDRLIYADTVLCGPKCKGRRQIKVASMT